MTQPVHDIQRMRWRKEQRCEKCGGYLLFRSALKNVRSSHPNASVMATVMAFGIIYGRSSRFRCEDPTCDFTRDFERPTVILSPEEPIC